MILITRKDKGKENRDRSPRHVTRNGAQNDELEELHPAMMMTRQNKTTFGSSKGGLIKVREQYGSDSDA